MFARQGSSRPSPGRAREEKRMVCCTEFMDAKLAAGNLHVKHWFDMKPIAGIYRALKPHCTRRSGSRARSAGCPPA